MKRRARTRWVEATKLLLALLGVTGLAWLWGDPPKIEVRIQLADQTVAEDRPFRTGERFRLEVTASEAGFLYIFYRNCDGEVRLLYPFREEDHRILENETRTLPEMDWLTFDGESGSEDVTVVLALAPVDWIEEQIEAHGASTPLVLGRSRRLKSLLRGSAGPVRPLELYHLRTAETVREENRMDAAGRILEEAVSARAEDRNDMLETEVMR